MGAAKATRSKPRQKKPAKIANKKSHMNRHTSKNTSKNRPKAKTKTSKIPITAKGKKSTLIPIKSKNSKNRSTSKPSKAAKVTVKPVKVVKKPVLVEKTDKKPVVKSTLGSKLSKIVKPTIDSLIKMTKGSHSASATAPTPTDLSPTKGENINHNNKTNPRPFDSTAQNKAGSKDGSILPSGTQTASGQNRQTTEEISMKLQKQRVPSPGKLAGSTGQKSAKESIEIGSSRQLISNLSSGELCSHCGSGEEKIKKREISTIAWQALVDWQEVNPATVDKAICQSCYNEIRDILIERADEIAAYTAAAQRKAG